LRIGKSGIILPGILLVLFFAGYVLYPFLQTALASVDAGGRFSLQHYRDLVDPGNPANLEAVGNSVMVSILSVVASGVSGVFLAFTLTQLDFRGRRILSRLAVMPIALPPLVGVIAFLFVFGESGIIPRVIQIVLGLARPPLFLDGIPAIVIVHAYSFHVYFYLMVSESFRRLDGSMLEAAESLGSSPWRTFRLVVLPQLRPALVGASVLTFMASMASFSAPYLFAGGKRFITLQIFTTKVNGELDLAAAQSVTLLTVSLGFFVIFNVLARGSTGRGGSKGVSRPKALRVLPAVKNICIISAVLLLALEMLPMLVILLVSFAQEGSWTSQLVPSAYTVENYRSLASDPDALLPFVNSLLMGVLTVSAALVIGVCGAYVLEKGGIQKGKLLLDTLLTSPYAIPGTVVAVGLIRSFNHPSVLSGNTVLVGTFWILPLAYLIRTYPLVVRSTAAALAQIDNSLLEAGQSLGAGSWRRFRRIVLPLLMPGILSGCLLAMIAAVGEFVSSILLYAYSSRPVSVEILAQLRAFNFGTASALCVVLLVTILGLVTLTNVVARKSAPRDLFLAN
jgi:iron(III) transport system permease protein